MELNRSQMIIVRLKEARQEQRLSISEIKSMVDATGAFVSISTIRRVFAEGSECVRFSYEETLVPIANALEVKLELSPEEQEENAIASIDSFVAVIREKNEDIEQLKHLLAQEKLAHKQRCRDYEERIGFLIDQIKKKDAVIAHLIGET